MRKVILVNLAILVSLVNLVILVNMAILVILANLVILVNLGILANLANLTSDICSISDKLTFSRDIVNTLLFITGVTRNFRNTSWFD